MTGPTHVISGLAAAVALGRLASVAPTTVEFLTLIVGTLAPDIDGRGTITRPGKILRPFLGRWIGGFIDGVFGLFTGTVRLLFGHRGFIHAPLLAVVFFALGATFERGWVTWFAIGYALHLLGDAMTVEGIPLWSPFSSRRMSLSKIRTGSRTERLVATGLVLVTVVFGWSLLPEGVKATQRSLFEAVWQKADSE